MASGIFGYFRFIQRGGQLKGQYMNRQTDGLNIETGTQENEEDGIFNGNYKTNWIDTEDRSAILNITRQPDSTFLLNWNLTNSHIHFDGRGIINEQGDLVGFYAMI